MRLMKRQLPDRVPGRGQQVIYDFTTKDVLNEVIRLSQEDPDFVYTAQPGREGAISCGYAGLAPGTTEGRSCIVGQALQNLGVPKDELIHLVTDASAVLRELHIEDDDNLDVLRTLNEVQENQDMGLSWGESVRYTLIKENYL